MTDEVVKCQEKGCRNQCFRKSGYRVAYCRDHKCQEEGCECQRWREGKYCSIDTCIHCDEKRVSKIWPWTGEKFHPTMTCANHMCPRCKIHGLPNKNIDVCFTCRDILERNV